MNNLIFFTPEHERRKGIIRTVSVCHWFMQLLDAIWALWEEKCVCFLCTDAELLVRVPMWPWLCLCSAVVSEEELDIPFLRWRAPLGTGQERENSSELLSPHPVPALQSTWVTDSLLKTGSSVAAAVKIYLDKCMVIVFLFGYVVGWVLVWIRPSAMVLQCWGPMGTWRSQPTTCH